MTQRKSATQKPSEANDAPNGRHNEGAITKEREPEMNHKTPEGGKQSHEGAL